MNKSFPDRRTAVLSLAATAAAEVIVPSELKGQTVMARTEQNTNVESIRGDRGASILGPGNIPLERENPDLLASPYTDAGIIPNLKFSFAATKSPRYRWLGARGYGAAGVPASWTCRSINGWH
jgi:hypothetical protein